MKARAAILIFSTTLIATIAVGCNKSQETTIASKSSSTFQVEVKDHEVTARVKRALVDDEKTNGFDIAVVTLKGDVKLTGFVNNQSQIDYVKKLARGVEGVHSIHDELNVKK
jgi:hyperosmotically inducible protein